MKLYELLLKPAEAQLRGKTNLIIAADNTLWDLPFQALVTQRQSFPDRGCCDCLCAFADGVARDDEAAEE